MSALPPLEPGTAPVRPRVPTRTLPALLRRELQRVDSGAVRFLIAKVSAVPDSKHVTILLDGATLTVPKLAGYTPTVNRAVYCLAADTLVIAIGEIA